MKVKGQLDEARQLYEQALNIDKTLGDPAAIAADLGRLGQLAEASKQTQQAMGYYDRAYRAYLAQKNTVRAAEALERLSRLARQDGAEDLVAHYEARLKALLATPAPK